MKEFPLSHLTFLHQIILYTTDKWGKPVFIFLLVAYIIQHDIFKQIVAYSDTMLNSPPEGQYYHSRFPSPLLMSHHMLEATTALNSFGNISGFVSTESCQ